MITMHSGPPYLLVLLGDCCHGVPVDVGTGGGPEAVLVDVQHGPSVHDGVPETVLCSAVAVKPNQLLELLGFWTLSNLNGSADGVTHRVTGFLEFVESKGF
jgi:hypothetical protein